MKFNHKTLIIISGAIWIAIGTFLMTLGINFILEALRFPEILSQTNRFSILSFLDNFVKDRSQTVILTVTIALMVGFLKGKMVLSKSVDRQIKRIAGLPNPASLKLLFSKAYYLLIAVMICLGISLRYFPISVDTRGAIDLAIGSALINGAMLYFRTLSKLSFQEKKSTL